MKIKKEFGWKCAWMMKKLHQDPCKIEAGKSSSDCERIKRVYLAGEIEISLYLAATGHYAVCKDRKKS
jgi:hypothetical protein